MRTGFRNVDVEMSRRASLCIAQGALTNSKRPESLVKGVMPQHAISGNGVVLKDTFGREYIDYICGLGTNLLGYGHTSVVAAAMLGLREGSSLSLSTDQEVKTAEKIKELFPFIDKVKFLNSGSEGCTSSLIIARAATGRKKVKSVDYHGFHPEFVSLTPPAYGVVEHPFIEKLVEPFEVDNDLAAVILEPIVTDLSDERIAYLKRLREFCTQNDTLLIFDETITAFRFPKYSVASYLNIEPDLIVFGKAIANGEKLSVVGGKAKIMDSDYFVSTTFAGHRPSLAAAHQTMTLLQKAYDVTHLWDAGKRFKDKFNEIAKGVVQLGGYNTRGVLVGEAKAVAIFMQEMCKSGVLFGPSWFYAFPHIQLQDSVLSIVKDVCMKITSGQCRLEGELPKKAFSAKVRENVTGKN